MSDTVETWKKRVASWRASGETAEAFSAGRPWSPKTLTWWSSRLGRSPKPKSSMPKKSSTSVPVVRVAQLVRAPTEREHTGAIVVEARDARVRITVEVGAELEMVVAVLGALVPEAR